MATAWKHRSTGDLDCFMERKTLMSHDVTQQQNHESGTSEVIHNTWTLWEICWQSNSHVESIGWVAVWSRTVTANRCSKSCTITCNRNMKQSHDAFWRGQNTKQSVMPALPISATTHTAGLFASGAGAACPRWRTCLLLVVAVVCASVQESNGFYPSIQFRVGGPIHLHRHSHPASWGLVFDKLLLHNRPRDRNVPSSRMHFKLRPRGKGRKLARQAWKHTGHYTWWKTILQR